MATASFPTFSSESGAERFGICAAGTTGGVGTSFLLHYAGALALTAVLLGAVFYAAHANVRMRMLSTGRGRAIRVIESTMLSPGTMLHIVRMDERAYLVGGGNGRLTLLDRISDSKST